MIEKDNFLSFLVAEAMGSIFAPIGGGTEIDIILNDNYQNQKSKPLVDKNKLKMVMSTKNKNSAEDFDNQTEKYFK